MLRRGLSMAQPSPSCAPPPPSSGKNVIGLPNTLISSSMDSMRRTSQSMLCFVNALSAMIRLLAAISLHRQ